MWLNRLYFILVLVALGAAAQGQDRPSTRDERARASRILKLALKGNHAYKTLARLIDTAPARFAGTPAALKAAEWGSEEMKRLGLKNVRKEPVEVPRWVRGSCLIEALPEGGAPVHLASLALGGSIGTPPEGIVAEILEVTSVAQLRARSEEAKNKVVFFNRPFDNSLRQAFRAYSQCVGQRTRGPHAAAEAGAVAAILRSVTSMPDDYPHTGATRLVGGKTLVPAAAISVVAAEKLGALLKLGPVKLRMKMSNQHLQPVTNYNVVGDIPGAELPDEIVLMGGHLDCWDVCDGAQDDGSGIAHCLEAARLILASGKAPRRTVRVVLYANEEFGLSGARAYAKAHAKELAQHVLAVESDSGGATPRQISCNGTDALFKALEPVAARLRALDLVPLVAGGGGADISTLAPAGVPLASLKPESLTYFDYHHSAKDNLKAIHPRELGLGAATLAIFVLGAADLPVPLPRNAISKPR